MKTLSIRSSEWDRMRAHVESEFPLEACGLLGGREGLVEKVVPVANLLASQTRFQMDPKGQVRAFFWFEHMGLDLIAIYHSHPVNLPEPSDIDLESWNYGGLSNLIWSKGPSGWICRNYVLEGNQFKPAGIAILESEEQVSR